MKLGLKLIDPLVRFRQLPHQLLISLRSLFFQPLLRYQALRLGRFLYHAFHFYHNLLHPCILPRLLRRMLISLLLQRLDRADQDSLGVGSLVE